MTNNKSNISTNDNDDDDDGSFRSNVDRSINDDDYGINVYNGCDSGSTTKSDRSWFRDNGTKDDDNIEDLDAQRWNRQANIRWNVRLIEQKNLLLIGLLHYFNQKCYLSLWYLIPWRWVFEEYEISFRFGLCCVHKVLDLLKARNLCFRGDWHISWRWNIPIGSRIMTKEIEQLVPWLIFYGFLKQHWTSYLNLKVRCYIVDMHVFHIYNCYFTPSDDQNFFSSFT